MLQGKACTCQKRKKQELTCAERPNRRCKGRHAHAQKEKARADVCGATQSPMQGKACTRPKRKKQELTCAERPNRQSRGAKAHAQKEKSKSWRVRRGPIADAREGRHTPKKEKARAGVCGEAQSPVPGSEGTRQKRKKQELTCAERPNRRCKGRKAHAQKGKSKS